MHKIVLSLVPAALIAVLAVLPAMAQPTPKKSCFFTSQFENWRPADRKTIYIRIGVKRFYRLDMQNECPALTSPDPHLITTFRGSNSVCTALDWDLKVSRGAGSIGEPCIVKTMTELSPAEAAAIPKGARP